MDNLFNDMYRGKSVLVTGHTGFKGSWFSLWLSKLGAEVVGYSKDIPTNPSHIELLSLDIASVTGDILDRKKLQEVIGQYEPEIVFHMAAQPIVRESYRNPLETFETNIIGTANVLEACRQNSCVKAIVNVTSDKCYQNNETGQAYKEVDPMGGYDPYSASKGCAELVANSYRNSFFNLDNYGKNHTVLLADARAGNVIGGGDWAKDRLIPDLVVAASKGEKVIIRSPKSVRPWQHVLEPLSGYLHLGWMLLEGKKEFADDWNFGPDEASVLTVQEVIASTKQHWDKIHHEVETESSGPHEAKLLTLDSTKARQQLNWRPVWKSSTTFAKTARWYKSYYGDGTVLSEDDLISYIEDAKKSGVAWAVTNVAKPELVYGRN